MKDTEKEYIKYYTECGKLIVIMIVGTLGGTITLLTSTTDINHKGLFTFFGLAFSGVFIYSARWLDQNIRKIIRNAEAKGL